MSHELVDGGHINVVKDSQFRFVRDTERHVTHGGRASFPEQLPIYRLTEVGHTHSPCDAGFGRGARILLRSARLATLFLIFLAVFLTNRVISDLFSQ
jgi:hypothetical protein